MVDYLEHSWIHFHIPDFFSHTFCDSLPKLSRQSRLYYCLAADLGLFRVPRGALLSILWN